MAKTLHTRLADNMSAWIEDGMCHIKLTNGTVVKLSLEKLRLIVSHLETLEQTKETVSD